jgi:hypothetical protein
MNVIFVFDPIRFRIRSHDRIFENRISVCLSARCAFLV